MSFALGIDLGGSSVKAVAVTPEGKLLDQANVLFDADEHFDWARKIASLVVDVEQRRGGQAQGVGLSAPGLAARDGLSIARMPGRLQGLEGLNWAEFLRPSGGTVPVLNDGHAALLGESWQGAARGFQNVIMLTLGTGVGGAAIVDGRLLKGALGRAGHFGHLCLDPNGERDVCNMPGSIEALIGNYNVESRSNGHFKTTHELVAAFQKGNAFAAEIWIKSVRALGCAISSLVNVLDPEAVIIGGGIARSGPALFEPLEKHLRDTEWNVGVPVKILPAQLGDLAGAYGAAYAACHQ
jgi:glucokinase